jgi:ankyrin repeat protein
LGLVIAKVLTRAAEEETLIGLAELFKIQDGIGNPHFSRVHENVLGLRAESLTQALSRDLAYLDEPDANGRTPISWAAARGNHEAVSTLMEHLADVNLVDVSGMTPLHYAATSSSITCLKLLLNNGADPSAKDEDRAWTPLHYAAFHQTDPTWVEELLLRGADVNVKTENLKTPLVLAIMKCHDLAARSLIKHGALINVKGMDGFTPLNSTLISNSSACMQVLIDAGISLNEKAWKGQTTLHLIALFANEEMIGCLMKADLSCLDLHAVDEAGQTAHMLLKARAASALVVKAFARLCAKVSDDIAQRWNDISF